MVFFKQVRFLLSKLLDNGTGVWLPMGSTGGYSSNKARLLNEYKLMTYACIDAIASDVGKYSLELHKPTAGGSVLTGRNHPIYALSDGGSDHSGLTKYELFYNTLSYYLLSGDIYWYFPKGAITGKPKVIDLLRPDLVDNVVENNEIVGYRLDQGDGSKKDLDLDEVVYMKSFNPFSEHRGLSVTEAALLYIRTENTTSEFQANFMANNASPSGVLNLKKDVREEVFDKLKKEWTRKYTGTENAGRTLVVKNNETSFTKIGLSLNELSMAELKDLNAERVRAMFKVPKAILGQTDQTGLGRANIEAIEYIFAKRTIEPYLTRLDGLVQKVLYKFWPNDNLVVGHASQVPRDKQFDLEQDNTSVNKWKTINEVRLGRGLLSVKGGDKLYHSFSEVSIDESADVSSKGLSKGHNHHRVDPKVTKGKGESQAAYFLAVSQIKNTGAKSYRRKLNTLLEDQMRRVVEHIESRSDKQLKTIVEAHDGEFTLIFSEEEVALLVDLKVLTLESGAGLALEFLGIVPEEDFILSQAAREAIFGSTDRLLKSFNEETALKIQKQIAAGLLEGDNTKQLTERIKSIYEDAEDYRARRIAVTEAHKAVNKGVAEGYTYGGHTKMKWVAIPPSCQFCKELDGTIVDIGTPFIRQGASLVGVDGGEFIVDYEDVQYADLHPNCDCKLLPA